MWISTGTNLPSRGITPKGRFESIDAIDAMVSKQGRQDDYRPNVLKYLWPCFDKGDTVTNLKSPQLSEAFNRGSGKRNRLTDAGGSFPFLYNWHYCGKQRATFLTFGALKKKAA